MRSSCLRGTGPKEFRWLFKEGKLSSDGMMSEGDIGSFLHSMLFSIFVGSSVLKVMLLNISKLICCFTLSMVNNWLSSKKEALSGAVRWSGEVGTPGDEDPGKLGGGVRVGERGLLKGWLSLTQALRPE